MLQSMGLQRVRHDCTTELKSKNDNLLSVFWISLLMRMIIISLKIRNLYMNFAQVIPVIYNPY